MESANTALRGKLVPNPKARLKDQFHEVARFKHACDAEAGTRLAECAGRMKR
jgi:hypothetical protein